MWRSMPNLDDSWRPDKSGILVETQKQDIPPQYRMRQGILLTLVGLPKAVLNRAAQQLIADLVAA